MEWVADRDGEIGSIVVDGETLRVVPPRLAKVGHVFVAKPVGPGVVDLKRPWATPTLTEYSDRMIESGNQHGAETATTTARS